MSRVVVIGPYPPTDDPTGDEVLATVRALRAAGAEVSVVSPVPSAAPAHGDPTRRGGAARVARAVRGADRVVWFGAGDAGPAAPLRRVLARIPSVERRPAAAAVRGRAPRGAAVADRVRRLRAGLPTSVRSVRARLTARR